MVAVSVGLHLALFAMTWGAGLLEGAWVPKPQQVIKARLVRLGPSRDKNLLPTLPSAPQPSPKTTVPPPQSPSLPKAPPPSPGAAPPSPVSAAAPADAARSHATRTQSALERLRKQTFGAPEGDPSGDADDALAGDHYIALVERCMKREFVIEGAEFKLVASRQAQALVRIGGNGKVVDFRLTQSSGLAAFDQAVVRAVRACSQVPPPPSDRREQLRRAGIVITFRP